MHIYNIQTIKYLRTRNRTYLSSIGSQQETTETVGGFNTNNEQVSNEASHTVRVSNRSMDLQKDGVREEVGYRQVLLLTKRCSQFNWFMCVNAGTWDSSTEAKESLQR